MARVLALLLAPALIALLLVALPRLAHADNVDVLIGQVKSGSVKLRLSAAVSLAKTGDPRAVLPLIKALADPDKNVRAAAALGLGKLITPRTKASVRKQAIAALERAAASDSNSLVKKQAAKALTTIGGSTSVATPGGGGADASSVATGSIYVEIGPMAATTEAADKMKALMRKATSKSFKNSASDLLTQWPGGRSPSRKDLDGRKASGFLVDGTLNELAVTVKGSMSIVSCKVSMLIATYPEQSVFGFLNGGAKVQASASAEDIALAKEDCVSAVVEDLVAKKIIPTIKVKGGK